MSDRTPTTEPKATSTMAELLHSRKQPRMELYVHLEDASSLSRALWLLLSGNEVDFGDCRDREAVKALASEVATHASAAMVTWNEDEKAHSTTSSRPTAGSSANV